MGDQPYGQPYQQPPMQPQSAGSKWGPTSMGMESHIAAGLSYFVSPLLPLIFFLMEKTNRFVKFHAMQSIILGIGLWVWIVVVGIIVPTVVAGAGGVADTAAGNTGAIGTGTGFLACGISCLAWVGSLAFIAGAIWGMISGFMGKYTKLPIVGGLAEKWAGGPAVPAY